MTLDKIGVILRATVVQGTSRDVDVKGVYACDLMSDVLAFVEPGCLLLTGLTNCHVIRTMEMAEISFVCFVRGKRPPDDMMELAKKRDITLLTTDLSMYEACGRLYEKGVPGCAIQE